MPCPSDRKLRNLSRAGIENIWFFDSRRGVQGIWLGGPFNGTLGAPKNLMLCSFHIYFQKIGQRKVMNFDGIIDADGRGRNTAFSEDIKLFICFSAATEKPDIRLSSASAA